MSQNGAYLMLFIVGDWAGREGFFDDLWTKAASVGGSDEGCNRLYEIGCATGLCCGHSHFLVRGSVGLYKIERT